MLSITRKTQEGIKLTNNDTNEDIYIFFEEMTSAKQGRFRIEAPMHYDIIRVDRYGNDQTVNKKKLYEKIAP